MTPAAALAERLSTATDERTLTALGFHDDDRADVHAAVAAAMVDGERMSEIGRLAERLRPEIGRIASDADPFHDEPLAQSGWGGIGVLPMLALLATTEDVRAFHRSRGIPPELSDRSLADLGQQVAVHRRTHGAFGLDTYGWVATTSFAGNLYWLGRLQYNLVTRPDGWALSTHIPETGPLAPESVDDSFRQAAGFFAEHFADYPTHSFYCGSWLLDPQLAEVLRPDSNMVRFQRLWRPEAELGQGDGDAVYFVFRKRGEVDRSVLPRETTLQRAVLDKLDAGGHWAVWSGTVDEAPYLA
ncbi:MAG: acyltransferase domain-containing protein [Microbacteriaceae bacterium]|nr:acyltransferase domain-containing protein [Microbacteriaceae bacterium]MCL2796378.1 acyltransferase domain-containing protein [Microbacteriaceae bacterium]